MGKKRKNLSQFLGQKEEREKSTGVKKKVFCKRNNNENEAHTNPGEKRWIQCQECN